MNIRRLGRKTRVGLFVLVISVVLFSVCFTSYEPLTVSGIKEHTKLHEERKPKQVFIQPQLKCMEHATKNTVVMVLNKASSSLRRDAIRQTWGQPEMQRKYNFSLYFIIGNEENVDLHDVNTDSGDILHVDVNEHYFNITEKVIEALNWVTHSCYESRFIFKIDDDVYFNIEFLKEIQNNAKYLPDDVILGDCITDTKPFRMTSKFRISYDDYPFQTFPPYCGGPGYAMTLHTAHKVYREMIYTRTFKFEDVYVGLVAYKLGISVKNVDYFIYAMDGYLHYIYIECARITHNLTPDVITKLWSERDKTSMGEHDCSSWGNVRYAIQTVFGLFSG